MFIQLTTLTSIISESNLVDCCITQLIQAVWSVWTSTCLLPEILFKWLKFPMGSSDPKHVDFAVWHGKANKCNSSVKALKDIY